MPPLLTQVARISDGMPLVASQTPTPGIQVTSQHQKEAKDILRKITSGTPTKMSIVSGDMIFYYMTRDSLCFLTMAESRYPKRLAFLYLDEIGDVVLSELVKEFDSNVRNKFFHRIIDVLPSFFFPVISCFCFDIVCFVFISGELKSIKQHARSDSSTMIQLFRESNGISKMNASKDQNSTMILVKFNLS